MFYLFIYLLLLLLLLNNMEYIINDAIWWFSKEQLSKTALHCALDEQESGDHR